VSEDALFESPVDRQIDRCGFGEFLAEARSDDVVIYNAPE